MQNAFLIIISLTAFSYTLFKKDIKVSIGYLIYAVSFILQIPEIASGFWADLLTALSLILFAFGSFVIIWPFKASKTESE